MADFILHRDGVYNIYSTVVDDCFFTPGLTLEQLTEHIRERHGTRGLEALPDRLDRAREKGTSSILDDSIEDCVCCNRSGPDEAHLPFDEFCQRYLSRD